MVRLALRCALESNAISTDVIDASEWGTLTDRFDVSSVPKVVIDDRHQLVGSVTEASFLEAVLTAARPTGRVKKS